VSRVLAAAVAFVIAAGGPPLRATQSPTPLIPRAGFFEYTQHWFELVRAHQIGEWDASAAEAARLPPAGLELIRADLHLIYVLLDGAVRKGESRVETPGKTLSLKALAPLLGVRPEDLDLPLDLRKLGDPDQRARRLISSIMTRAAMMHTRIALERETEAASAALPPPAPQPGIRPEPPNRRPGAVLIRDGRQTRITNRSIHWAIAREALDSVGPPRAGSDTARLWYQAAAAYLQQERDYSALLPHAQHAREIFPDDAPTWFYSGAAYENLAAPKVQAAVDESDGTVRALGSPEDLLKQADQYYRRALQLDPDSAMVRLRQGRVLDQLGRHEEAVVVLRRAESTVTTDAERYLAALFLGGAEESLHHDAGARTAYGRAMLLYPSAQSPRLADAILIWRANDRGQSAAGLRALSGIDPFDLGADPYWTYDCIHTGDVPALFERLRRSAIEAVK